MPLANRLSMLSRSMGSTKTPGGDVTPYSSTYGSSYGSKRGGGSRTDSFPRSSSSSKASIERNRTRQEAHARIGRADILSSTFRTSRRGNSGYAPSAISSNALTKRSAYTTNTRSLGRGLTRRTPSPTETSSIGEQTLASSTSSSSKGLICDKCDGKHETDRCPHFRKKRDNHPDALRRKPIGLGSGGRPEILRKGRVVPQPPDGSCLFHSMSYGLKDGSRASTLRREITSFIERNPGLKICDTPLKDWVKWDSGSSCASYARRMASGGWGGGIEMAAFSHLKQVNVYVYERFGGSGFKRISCFEVPHAKQTVRVVYRGGVHYDALVV